MRQFGGRTNEGPLRIRSVDRRPRSTASGTRGAGRIAAASCGRRTIVGAVIAALLVAPAAAAAAGPTPDRPPGSPASDIVSSPVAPDPAPARGTGRSTTGSVTHTGVISAPTVTTAPPSGSAATQAPAPRSAPIARPAASAGAPSPAPVKRVVAARSHAADRVGHPPGASKSGRSTVASGLAWKLTRLAVGLPITFATKSSERSGLLLLLAALALTVLVLASGTLVRLLVRMHDELWEAR